MSALFNIGQGVRVVDRGIIRKNIPNNLVGWVSSIDTTFRVYFYYVAIPLGPSPEIQNFSKLPPLWKKQFRFMDFWEFELIPAEMEYTL